MVPYCVNDSYEKRCKEYRRSEKERSKIFITDYDTINGYNFNEMSINEFISKLSKNIESNLYDVVLLDKDGMEYQITYDGNTYYLSIDSTYQSKETIKWLKRLAIKEDIIRANEKELDRKNELLECAKKGIIGSEEARELYLEYLENSKKFCFTKLKQYFLNLKEDIVNSYSKADDIFDCIMPFSSDLNFFGKSLWLILASLLLDLLILCGIAISKSAPDVKVIITVKELISTIIPSMVAVSIPTAIYSFIQIKNRIKRLVYNIKERKLVNHKISKLQRSKRKEKELLSKTEKNLNQTINEVENVNLNEMTIKTIALNEINGVVNKLVYINQDDRKQLYVELKQLLNEFNVRMERIEEANKRGIDSITLGDSEEKLKIDIISKVGNLEARILEIRKKDMVKNQILSETKKVEENLDSVMNNETIDYSSNGFAYQKKK